MRCRAPQGPALWTFFQDFRSQWKELNRIVSEHPHLHLPQKELRHVGGIFHDGV